MRTYTSYYGTSTASPAYSDGGIARIINNTLTDNLNWGLQEVNQSLRYLTTKYYFNERTYTVPGGTVSGTQFYNLPPQVKKLINVTVTIANVLWQCKECPSKEYWDYLNTITFNQDYPSWFFVWNGQVGIFPTPSSSSNILTLNYKTRIIDLSQADYSTGTVSITTNTATVTGSGTTFTNSMAGQWIRIAFNATNSANGDNQWYQINSVTNATTLVLKNVYSGATVAVGTYTIGEAPLLPEDYQDLPLYRMGIIYYTTRFPDATRADEYRKLYAEGFAMLDDEFGSKSTSVVLQDTSQPIYNPNNFQSSITQI